MLVVTAGSVLWDIMSLNLSFLPFGPADLLSMDFEENNDNLDDDDDENDDEKSLINREERIELIHKAMTATLSLLLQSPTPASNMNSPSSLLTLVCMYVCMYVCM